MKKIALAVLLSSGLMAAESGFYVGADIGNTAMDMTTTFNGDKTTVSDDGGSQTLKVGYYIDKNNRASAFYQNVNVDGGDVYAYGIGYDYLIGDSAFKPFIGAQLGYGSVKADGTTVDIAGITYGAQAGINYAVNENFSLEAGYRYLITNMEDSISGPGGTATFEIDSLKNWFIGVNYKF
ncbi:porin family protein [bacterium]|nr:porin family protein [bacterium]MBU1434736.1 porin family protein [bacterium]MBU1502724.1 porin family protein [bacterium]